ncbi:MAG: hypothetical protein OXI77_06100 [Chloroflexota bacterium]|nr:hypothetical protein [Chloroflexota bacterium]MDE2909781.1 hypothetical protein [Chloroflexota bacterium]
MSVPGLLIALVLSLFAMAAVARPLLRPPKRERAAASSQREQCKRIETYYERVLTNIRDLDEDFATGKINEGDYQSEREVWVERGIRLLRVRNQVANEQARNEDSERIDRAIEEALAVYRERLQTDERSLSEGDAT